MSWREQVLVEWLCDGCSAETSQVLSDGYPPGWRTDDDGRDLCPACAS